MKKHILKIIALLALQSIACTALMGQRTVIFSGVDFSGNGEKNVTRDGVTAIGYQNESNSAGHTLACVTPNGGNNSCIDFETCQRRMEFEVVSDDERITCIKIVFKVRDAGGKIYVVHAENKPVGKFDNTIYDNSGANTDLRIYELLNGGWNVTPAVATANGDNCSGHTINYSGEVVRKVILSSGLKWKNAGTVQYAVFSPNYNAGNVTNNTFTVMDNNTTNLQITPVRSWLAEVTLCIESLLPACVTPPADVNISGTQTYCQNATATPLTAAPQGGDPETFWYKWYSNTTNSNTGGTAIEGAASDTYTPSTTTVGTTYYYVEVWNGSGACTVTSAPYSVTVNSAPKVVVAYTDGGSYATLSWTAPPGVTVTGYNVYSCPTSACAAMTPLASLPATTTTYNVDGLDYYVVEATFTNACSSISSPVALVGRLNDPPIDTTPAEAGPTCGTLLAATTFAPASSINSNHISIDEVLWYDITNSVKLEIYPDQFPEAFALDGSFMTPGTTGYAIVSDPSILSSQLMPKNDGSNYLVYKLPYTGSSDNNDPNLYPLFKLSINGIEAGTNIMVKADFEYIPISCSSPHGNSSVRGWSSTGDKNPRDFSVTNRISGFYDGNANGITESDRSFWWRPTVKRSNDCGAIAFKSIYIYGCADKYVQKDFEGNSVCQGKTVNLRALGLGTATTGYEWYVCDATNSIWDYTQDDDACYEIIPGETGNILTVDVEDLILRRYKAKYNGEFTKPADVQGKVCCEVAENTSDKNRVVWSEDFGVVQPAQNRNPDPSPYVVNHTHLKDGEGHIFDGYYAIISNTSGSQNAVGSWPTGKTDHTGNIYGGFLVINLGGSTTNVQEVEIIKADVMEEFCAGTWYNFSMWTSQLASAQENPASFILRLWELLPNGSQGALLNEIYTGIMDINQMERWANYTVSTTPTTAVSGIRIQVISVGMSGNGNDLVFDDLQFTVCSPEVELKGGASVSCGTMVPLNVEFEGQADSYFSETYFLWQKSTDGGTTWVNDYGPAKNADTYSVIPYDENEELLYRVIVAGSAAVAVAVADGDADACEMYNITNVISLTCSNDCPFSGLDITSDGEDSYCADDIISPPPSLTVTITGAEPGNYTVVWEKKSTGDAAWLPIATNPVSNNGASIDDVTDTYTLPALPESATQYRVIITPDFSDICEMSAIITITVSNCCPAPELTPVEDIKLCEFETVDLTTIAAGICANNCGGITFTYWRGSGGEDDLDEETAKKIGSTGSDESDTYYIVVENDCGTSSSEAVDITIYSKVNTSPIYHK